MKRGQVWLVSGGDRIGGMFRAVRPRVMPIIYLHMNLDEFRNSLTANQPPKDLSLPLAALWWDAKGDWAKAHEFAQQDEGPAGA